MKKHRVYSVILICLGAFATLIDGNLASFIFLTILGGGLFFFGEDAVM